MEGREVNENGGKVQYEIDRENKIKNNYALLKKLNLHHYAPKNIVEIAKPGSSQPKRMAQKVSHIISIHCYILIL